MLITKSNYAQASLEVQEMIKDIYPDRVKRKNYTELLPRLCTKNVLTYSQSLMNFHDTNSVPHARSTICLKIKFHEDIHT